MHNFQIGTFEQRQLLCHAVDALDMIKPMHRIDQRVPVACTIQCQHL